MIKSSIHILFWCCISALTFAQAPFFKTYQLPETHLDASLRIIYEDSNSMIWFGTSEGLFNYDGIRFELIPLPSDSADQEISAISQSNNETLWVGYKSGEIYQLDYSGKLKLWQPEEGLPKVPITGLYHNADGVLWIATYGEGVYYFTNNRLYNINTDDGLLGDDIYTIVADVHGRIWAATDGGISICSLENRNKKIENITKNEGLPDEIVKTILRDRNDNMWIGMFDKGVCYYDVEEQQFHYPIADWKHGVVNQLEIFEGTELWIGTNGDGVFRYDFKENQLSKLKGKNSLGQAKIHDLHKDIEGNIWILSNNSNICSANRQFEYVECDIPNIQAIYSDHQNTIWIGSQQGLYRHHTYSGTEPEKVAIEGLEQLNIISLYEDQYHHLWIGTFGEGVYVYAPESGKIRHITQQEGLDNGSILAIKGKDNDIWLATLGGVTRFGISDRLMEGEPLEYRNFHEQSGLGTNFIYNIFIDQKDRLWFATDGKGITVLENGQFINYPTAGEQELQAVYSITQDQESHIWLSTAKQGIYQFKEGSFHQLSLPDGIRDLEITSLITDAKGDILIIHKGGIDLLNPESSHLIYYDDEVGLKNLEPNLNVACKDQYGNIWLGGHNQLVKYTVLEEPLSIHPRTVLNTVSIFLDPINPQLETSFKHNQNYISFNYVGLWYTDPATVLYRYKLDGYDLSWKSSKDRQASYSNLPPGDYTFMLQSTENEAFAHSEPIISYAFTIAAPLWQRWWFILLSALIIGAIFLSLMRYRETQLNKEAILKKEKIESQFETLKSQINPHFLFNSFNTLITIIEENPELAVEYVEHLSDFYRSILQYRQKEVISLEEEIELVKNYSFLLKKRFGDNLNLQIRTNGQPSYVAPLTLQMLIENAVKHNVISRSKPLQITISKEDEDYISISNNLQKKIGLQSNRSTGFGLQSIITRYQLLSDKKIIIEQTNEQFKVRIPIIKNSIS